FWLEREPNQRSIDQLLDVAPALLKGCLQHFLNQITRVKKISGVVDPSKQDIFENYARRLLRCNSVEEFHDHAERFIKAFPLAKSWIRWWMLPAHAIMLFPSFREMSAELWDSIPATTNAEEAMHWKLYAAIGKLLALMQGLKSLYSFAVHYQKLYDAAGQGVKIFYGSDPQHWKRATERFGYTKYSRHHARSGKTTNDGRPPDTGKALMSKRKAAGQVEVYEKSYAWKDNSCWLDSSLTLISTAAAPNYSDCMAPMFLELPEASPLRNLLQVVYTRIEGVQLVGREQGGCKLLNDQRDGFRRELLQVPNHKDRNLRSFNSMFGWLHAMTDYRRRGEPVDPAHERACSFFRMTSVKLRTCTGSTSADHWQLTLVQQKSECQLSATVREKYSGDIRKWFQDLVRVGKGQSRQELNCWQTYDGNSLCDGRASTQEVILNIPVVLVIEMGDTQTSAWNIPASIAAYVNNSAASAAGVKYKIVGHVYAGNGHFIARYISSSTSKPRIFDYDDRKHEGHAIQLRTRKPDGWLTGPSQSIDLPEGYQIYALVYRLEGGEKAQHFFRKHQIAQAQALGLRFEFNSPDNGIPFACSFQHPNAERVADENRFWLKANANNEYPSAAVTKTIDYVSNRPRSPRKGTWHAPLAFDPPAASKSRVKRKIKSTAATPDPLPHSIFPLPSPRSSESDVEMLDVVRSRRTSTASTNSRTPCRVWCCVCHEHKPDGDDDVKEVQCVECRYWSHMECLQGARNLPDDFDWANDGNDFVCDRCGLYNVHLLLFKPNEILLMPLIQDGEWRASTVQWYPAQFVQRHADRAGLANEFELRWVECVDGAPQSALFLSRLFCEEVIVVLENGQIRSSQNDSKRLLKLPKVRVHRMFDHEFNNHENPDLSHLFNAALPSVAKILAEFNVNHPLVRHYAAFANRKPTKSEVTGTGKRISKTDSLTAHFWMCSIGLFPTAEMSAILAPILERLLRRDELKEVLSLERSRRVFSVGAALLQMLAVQNELGEQLNLNGDFLDDLRRGRVVSCGREGQEVIQFMMSAVLGSMPGATSTVEKHAKLERRLTVWVDGQRPPSYRRLANSTYDPTDPILIAAKRTAEEEAEGDSERIKKVKEDKPPPKPKPRRRRKNSP
ncbi:hypothetical protein R3P38DRAFT_3581024, partial [Favolaschia claudopus]